MKKYIFCILLSVTMVITMIPVVTGVALAETPDYFCITNTSKEEATVIWKQDGFPDAIDLYYKIDDGEWSETPLDFTINPQIVLPANSSVYFKSNTGKFSKGASDCYSVDCNKRHTVSGDITTLLNGVGGVTNLTSAGKAVFEYLFYNDSELSSAQDLVLPSTTLTENCYYGMFCGCINLVSAPRLPAKKLTVGCYSHLFCYCNSLATAIVLPSVTLTEGCYDSMFYSCENLSEITMLATDIHASRCLKEWTDGVAPNGTFIKNSAITKERLGSAIPTGWTVKDFLSPGGSSYNPKDEYGFAKDGTFMKATDIYEYNQALRQDDIDIITEIVKGFDPRCKTTKLEKGIKVNVYLGSESASSLKQLVKKGYEVKYNWYRSTKKNSGYKFMFVTTRNTYTNTAVKKGQRYYYKCVYEIYDDEGLICKTKLKDCLCGNRKA